ncbi:MAG: nucleoside:proton symporter, partial [Alphaproteobacteria bacterium]|nr:nucleoside:proton symporter [Alphaproteobacteria bacterium]
MVFLQACLGITTIFTFCWLISEKRKQVDIKAALIGLAVQVLVAVIISEVGFIRAAFFWLGDLVLVLKEATLQGTSFVFGYIGGGEHPFNLREDGANTFSLTFQALPMVFVVSALSMLLFYWGILPAVVRGLSWALRRTLNIGGALGVCAAAKVFLGQMEAPLLIRPYMKSLSRSELFTVMTLGMATTSGTVMALYATILETVIPNVLAHIITASIISIPAAITISRILVPQVGEPTSGKLVMPYEFNNSMDALSKGTVDGIRLFINIVAMLIVFVALVALVNKVLGCLPQVYGEDINLQRILGTVLAPITWLMGIPWEEAKVAASLLGTKTILNEIYAFVELSRLPEGAITSHTRLIMLYALCGFANLSSLGIQIGGLGVIAPERRNDVISLGFKAILAGSLSTILSG